MGRIKMNNIFEKTNTNWKKIGRKEQQIPETNWFGWLIMAGRGFGKTRTAAEAIKHFVLKENYRRICLIGETFDEVRNVMIEGESGLLNIHSNKDRPKFSSHKRQLTWPNGAVAHYYSSTNPDTLRGPQFDLAWIDELAKFDNAQKVFDQLMLCLRLGKNPRFIISTTPRYNELLIKLKNRKDIYLTTGTTFDNKDNLSANFIEMIKQEYQDTFLGSQEIEGKLINNENMNLWNLEDIEYSKNNEDVSKMQIIIGIDPAVNTNENANETGIIVAGKIDNRYYIIEDFSQKINLDGLMELVSRIYDEYQPIKIIIEKNQGGDILLATLKAYRNLPWIGVYAKDNKYNRAIPISSLYKQKKVIHLKKFEALEQQQLNAHKNFEKDRLDALVWALFYLMEEGDKEKLHSEFSCW